MAKEQSEHEYVSEKMYVTRRQWACGRPGSPAAAGKGRHGR